MAVLLSAAASLAPAVAAPVYGYQVLRTYPHDPSAFTEGLFYLDGYLYESTGLEGRSNIRKVKLDTGEVLQQRDLSPAYFGEGIVAWKGKLVELTWRSQIGFVYDLATFAPKASFRYPGEGWALTHDDHRLIMSDGTADIRFLDPDTLKQIGTLHVTDDGQPVEELNEVEWVKGLIYANIWQTSRIACIDPKTGHVVRWIDLAPLVSANADTNPDKVLNGIAYDAKTDRLFVTGKLWSAIYQIKLVPPPK
ncbi:MAG TPA: glutaminyl-peptide cyclotransferase [Caulobacteraceae bacterium]|nr:glutaminyl-peptide cyclotransferase [Caulobacteraceae bacterium]